MLAIAWSEPKAGSELTVDDKSLIPPKSLIPLPAAHDWPDDMLDEPELGLVLGDALEFAESVGSCSSLGDSLACSGEDDVEIHTEDTSGGIVLNSEIDVLINTKSEVACSI